MGHEVELSDAERRSSEILNQAIRLRKEIAGMSLGDFTVNDLTPILRVMGDYHGATMLNDAKESDITQLRGRIAEAKAAKRSSKAAVGR